MIKVNLGGSWILRGENLKGEVPARVPGSVISDLLENKLIGDPFFRENEYEVRDLFYKDYTYSRTFEVSEGVLAQDAVELACYGLDTIADIHINGFHTGKADNMHAEWRFNIKKLLRRGMNEIEICLRSPLKFIDQALKEDGEITFSSCGNIPGSGFIRKAHCMFGWDWGPQLPDAGIWRDIAIEAFSGARMHDLHVTQVHGSDGVVVHGTASVEVLTKGGITVDVEFEHPDGSIIGTSCVVENGCGSFDINVENPRLWWPNGYGEHPLYKLTAVLKHDGIEADRRTIRIGLRTMKLSRQPDQWGEEFCFVVNNVKIFAMGANYIPEDNILRRVTPARTGKLLTDCIRANFNLIRVWGGGYYPDTWFYDICDELGLIVWQDLMFACNIYRLTGEFEKSISLEAEQNVKRIRHHACLGLLCGNNEMETAWNEWGEVKSHKSALKEDYLRQFETVLKRICEDTAPEVDYWPSSPSSGGNFDNPNDENRGDMHYWEVWHAQVPFEKYREHYFRFCSEFGMQSFPSVKTVKSFALPEDMNIFSRVMESHQKNGSANGKILAYIADNYKYPGSFESLVYTSQLIQADAMRCGVEHWRRNRGRCMGAVYWQLNDCWPGASWSGIDCFGRWKALHYAARKFYAPVLLSADDHGKQADLHVSNESMRQFRGEVQWHLRDNAGKIIRGGTINADIPALSSRKVCTLDFSKELDAGTHPEDRLMLDYRLYMGNLPISEGSLLFSKPKYFEFLAPDIRTEVEETGDEYIILLTAANYARGVFIEPEGADCLLEDNLFDLYPGEVRKIHVAKKDISAPAGIRNFREQLKLISVYDI